MAFLRRSGHFLVADTEVADSATMYLVALGAVAVALLIRLPLSPLFGFRFPYLTFFPAVFFAAWYGGLRPALLATGLGAVAVWFAIVPPAYSWKALPLVDLVGMGLYVGIGISVGWLGGARLRAEREARSHAERAEQEAVRAEEEASRAEEESVRAEEEAAQAEEERIRAEDQVGRLQESETRFRTMADTAPVMIWVADADRRMTFVSRGWLEFTGRPVAQELGEGWAELLHPADAERALSLYIAAWEARRPFSAEYRYRRRDGIYRWIRNDGVPRVDGHGQFLGYIGAGVDLTESRAAEERVRLAQRLEAVGRLAGGVAHETNNQMTVVLGAASFLLRRAELSPEVRQDIETIRQAAERAAGVSTQLLAFSRRQLLRPQALEVDGVIAGMEPVLQRILGEECRLQLRLDRKPKTVVADAGQLEQVLLNLAINARDAMGSGGVLSIETGVAELTETYAKQRPGVSIQPGMYAVLTVTDNGHGMDRDTVSHLFEPFFTTKPVGQGTGLGLSVVYGIVKQSGGYVWAYSEPGLGTSFRVYLPLAEMPAPAGAEQPRRPRTGSGETILVVEDDAEVRRQVVRGLEEEGFTVAQAEHGAEALEVARRVDGHLHLVVSDVSMPTMAGRELALRLAEIRPDLPVLFISGYPGADVVQRGLLDAGRPFIQKPFTPEALAEKVRELLARK
jgi:two-component system cell cycle sensor histidine kinase/response regulator CckA